MEVLEIIECYFNQLIMVYENEYILSVETPNPKNICNSGKSFLKISTKNSLGSPILLTSMLRAEIHDIIVVFKKSSVEVFKKEAHIVIIRILNKLPS